MKRPLYVMVPRLDDGGAVKGAVALCNGLTEYFSISLICLKGIVNRSGLKTEVTTISLDTEQGFRRKYKVIKKLLNSDHGKPLVISLCFSADLMNFFLRSRARTIASLRGNIATSYPKKYGFSGHLLAWIHYLILRQFDRVVVLSETMKRQAERLHLKNLSVVGNFVDEPQLEMFRLTSPKSLKERKKTVIYVGSFIKRKRADLMIQVARLLRERNVGFQVMMLGDGPLRGKLEKMVKKYNLKGDVRFLGHVQDPYALIQEADLLVLPSESEGIPRAVLESLFFGIPCILRNVDANLELIQHGVNGYLFHSDKELGSLVAEALLTNPLKSNRCLIPFQFRYKENIHKVSEMLNEFNH